jgi:hypothetical protein
VYADYLIATQENKETNKEIFEKIVEYGKFHL